MKTVRYACTHCGKRFEAEEKELLECPGCFWSTSVKKEEELPAGVSASQDSPKKKSAKTFRPISISPALRLAGIFVIGIIFVFLTLPFFKKLFPSRTMKIEKVSEIPAPDKGTVPAAPAPAPSALSSEEKNILARRLDIRAERPLSAEEEKILKNQAPFTSGIVEKLPSQAWTLDDYEKMIEAQQKFYKVTLPGSYKKKLTNLFKEKYTPAAEAFKNGQLLEARDLWVESLAFPVYGNNVQKHRGVVLTMLRGFINDTLSKVGAINSALSEAQVREREADVTGQYLKLLKTVEAKSWKDAYGIISELQPKIQALGSDDPRRNSVKPYPEAALNLIDEGIRNGLFDVLNVQPASVADLEPIERDLVLKRKVIESLIPENLEPVTLRYQEALDLITQEQWAGAEAKLKEISFPVALYEDAREKIRVLRKLQGQTE